ncbi:TerC family protein [Agrococcus jejuensis]|uniref:Membrane protein TerC, possibly involved in tellurium resistance n=1 Tax=Agrococcus jejuensis TaxID=399736 RepID=A0A1G8C866_9MICO|nr:TerC family protein [Agrococcus jejuensis]SDH41575.1 Membrane protein TerC, possibly involved in tellurium resistance [Agrococcus jejuensis]
MPLDFSLEFTPDLVAVFLTLFVLEVVLGVDNVIFISILAAKLPADQQAKARNLGLTLAMVMRVLLVLLAGWIITLTQPLFTIGFLEGTPFDPEFSGKDLILILGGGFLLYKAVTEIHHKLEGADDHGSSGGAAKATFGAVIAQILALDLVFSLDSVITAVGMTDRIVVIITVVVLSFGLMLVAAKHIFTFVNNHPTVKMLALAFLVLIGVFLVAEGFGFHIEKAFIYGPMVFAVLVEVLNLAYAARKRKRTAAAKGDAAEPEKVRLHSGYTVEEEQGALQSSSKATTAEPTPKQ